jgi:hypothetical protein
LDFHHSSTSASRDSAGSTNAGELLATGHIDSVPSPAAAVGALNSNISSASDNTVTTNDVLDSKTSDGNASARGNVLGEVTTVVVLLNKDAISI